LASLRSYEQPIRDILAEGNIPVVVFGDSTIRGTGAIGDDVWTRQLEKRLQAANSRVRVLNYAQNAGDLMGPFLYHHLQRIFPQARYIVQWHFASEVGLRHPFHYWLTSEIALRDGRSNPAVLHAFKTVPISKWDERGAFVLAAFNILTNYLDAGNWVRYRWLGRIYQDSDRRVKVGALHTVGESDVTVLKFVPPEDEKTIEAMRGYFSSFLTMRDNYVQRPLLERAEYFARMFPADQRSHLLLFTLDLSPYYAPRSDVARMDTWRTMWAKLRTDMALIPNLSWVSLTGSAGELEVDDYVDLGHLTPSGQRRLAEVVGDKLTGPGGWFDPSAPEAERPPSQLKGQWYDTSNLQPNQLAPFSNMRPKPSRFFSTFGPGLDTIFYNAHPVTRLCFRIPEGDRRLQTTVRLDPGTYEKIPANETATDGIELEIALLDPAGRRRVVYRRSINPTLVASDRGLLPVDVRFIMPANAELELYVGPGPDGRDTRDWAFIGPLIIN